MGDSKFTIQTVEKVEEYLKKMEMLKQEDNSQSIDITDDDEHKSETMLNEMKRELRRPSVSVTDEELITDMTSELLQERNIEEIKKHLEETRARFEQEDGKQEE